MQIGICRGRLTSSLVAILILFMAATRSVVAGPEAPQLFAPRSGTWRRARTYDKHYTVPTTVCIPRHFTHVFKRLKLSTSSKE